MSWCFSEPDPSSKPVSLSRTQAMPPPSSSSAEQKAVYPPVIPPTALFRTSMFHPQRPTVSAPFPDKQIGYVSPPPIPTLPSAYSRSTADSVPPIGSVAHTMVEDFNSLTIGSVPGSSNSGIDIEALPRPLEDYLEPNSFAEMYPMNCDLRYLRLTTHAIPKCDGLVSKWNLPLGAVICPLAEAPRGEGPVIALPMTRMIRCETCRAIVNPYTTFTDGGRIWQCNICAFPNNVPENYPRLETNGIRMDLADRPELINGSVEYVADQGYMLQPSKPPVYFFLIDVSINANKSGMLGAVAEAIRSCLDRLASFPGAQIGFITFDSSIHFYEMTSSLIQPRMCVISDIDDIFLPLPCGLLVNLSESRALVDALLDCLPSMFQSTSDVESAFGPAVKAANMVMSKVGGGKLLIFQNTLPSLGTGRVCLHQDTRLFPVQDKDHVPRLPGDPFYSKMADEFTKHGIVVDVYVFSDNDAIIASLGTLSSYTGGQVYYYPNFMFACHKEQLRYDLGRDLMRETAWGAVLRVRCGRGLRIASIHGNLMFGATDLLSHPALDCDKAYTALLFHEGTLQTSHAYFQVSLAYTSSSGESRIRVHTAALPVVTDLLQMYRHADTGAIVSLYSRLAIEKTMSPKSEDARIFIQQQIVKAMREYQSFFWVQNRLGRMFYPESLKYLPLYGFSLSKSAPLRWVYSDAHIEKRCAQANIMMALPVKRLLKLLYPSLFRIDDYLLNASPMVDEFKKTCKRLPLSAESLDSSGLYLYDDGFRFVIFFGIKLLPEIATKLLGERFGPNFPKVGLFEHDNGMARKLQLTLEKLREENPSGYQLLDVVREVEQPAARSFSMSSLIEDPADDANGYADWILNIFQHIQ